VSGIRHQVIKYNTIINKKNSPYAAFVACPLYLGEGNGGEELIL